MADEKTEPEQVEKPSDNSKKETPTAAPAKTEQPTWTDAQKADYTRKTQQNAHMVNLAKEDGYDDPVQAYNDMKNQRDKFAGMVDTVANTLTPPKEETPQSIDNSAEYATLIKEQQASTSASFTAKLGSDWNEYRFDMKEAGGEIVDKVELRKFMNEESATIGAIYQDKHKKDGDANYYKVAADYKLFMDTKGSPKAETDVLDTDLAESTASVTTSQAPPAGDKPPTDNASAADEIVPDDVT